MISETYVIKIAYIYEINYTKECLFRDTKIVTKLHLLRVFIFSYSI